MENIKGILMDAGGVLNRALSGDFKYSPNFFDIVGKEKLYGISKDKMNDTYGKAWEFVNSVKYVFTLEDEWRLFHEFFVKIDKGLPELEIGEKLSSLTDDMVMNFDKYKFYDDVFETLPKLSKDYKLAVVSDSWPSLREVCKKAKLDNYFSDMIISTEVGICKPDEKIFKVALDSLGLKPNEVIYVDDNPTNCYAAEKLGIKSIVLDRNAKERIYGRSITRTNNKIIKDMNELLSLLS